MNAARSWLVALFALVAAPLMSSQTRAQDCNGNGIDDVCDLSCAGACSIVPGCGQIADCNGNSIPDDCDAALADCNQSGVPDECDVTSGASEDCNGDLVPDECEPFSDCNANTIRDTCDIESGFSTDSNGDWIPDECCPPPCAPDEPLLPNTFGTCSGAGYAPCDTTLNNCSAGQFCDPCNQNRYLSFEVPDSWAGSNTAVRVELTSLHHPTLPPPGALPSFVLFEGQFRYLNTIPEAIARCCNPNTDPLTCNTQVTCTSDADCVGLGLNTKCEKQLCPDSPAFRTFFRCARIGCTPEYRDWGSDFAGQVTYATGETVIPSSQYALSGLAQSCMGNEAACAAASAPLLVGTERWGNVDCSNAVSGVPSAMDVARIVDKVRDGLGAFIKPRVQLREAAVNPRGNVGAQDIARIVDAAKGVHYPFHFNCTAQCSSNSQCPGSSCVNNRCVSPPACTSNADCSSFGLSSSHTCSANGYCTNVKEPCTGLCQP